MGGEDAALGFPGITLCLGLGPQHHGAGAIAEEDAGCAIGPVKNPGKRLCPDDQGALGLADLDEIVGNGQGINKARADSLDVECGAPRDTQSRLNLGSSGREGLVGCGGAKNDQVDVIGRLA